MGSSNKKDIQPGFSPKPAKLSVDDTKTSTTMEPETASPNAGQSGRSASQKAASAKKPGGATGQGGIVSFQ